MKKELLSPVGNMESLYQAIHNGCDAVYLGGKKFGARMFADNFAPEDLQQAIRYCHLYGVKIYVTVNTIIFDSEIEDFLDYIEFLYVNGVDAVIMQDIGMISLVHKKYPLLEIHASTQTHNHNSEGIKLLKDLGVKRVVLARELSLDEIKNIDVDIEKEVFIHGALCVCYSGCCLFSAMNTNRSGNRGECIASCRLPYELYKNDEKIKTDGNYLLSMKELNTSKYLKDILDSDIISLKIEGRMKSPEYVGFITKFYRTLIDKYYNNQELTIDNEEINELKALFNRQFTNGYLFNEYGKEVMNIKSPNHIGLRIGKVIEVDPKYIKIKLDQELNQEDGIKFTDVDKGMIVNKLYNSKMLLTNSISSNNIAIVDNKVGLKEKSNVSITIDSKLLKKLHNYEEKEINIDITVKALLNTPLEISFTDSINTSSIKGDVVGSSTNRPVGKEDIIKQLSKLGNTPFRVNNINIEMDSNIFIPLSSLNNLRRELTEDLINKRCYVKKKKINTLEPSPSINRTNEKKISILVRNEEQLLTALSNNVDYIYVSDINLFNKYKSDSRIYLRLDRVINKFQEYKNTNLLVCELGGINKYSKDNEVCSNYYLNVNNNKSIKLLESLGVKRVTLSPEVIGLSKINSKVDVEIVIYGRIELMITKYCPLNMLINKDDKKCDLCLNKDNYYLKDKELREYPLLQSKHITHIMDSKAIDKISNINTYLNKGINVFRIELFNESSKKVEDLIKELRGALYE